MLHVARTPFQRTHFTAVWLGYNLCLCHRASFSDSAPFNGADSIHFHALHLGTPGSCVAPVPKCHSNQVTCAERATEFRSVTTLLTGGWLGRTTRFCPQVGLLSQLPWPWRLNEVGQLNQASVSLHYSEGICVCHTVVAFVGTAHPLYNLYRQYGTLLKSYKFINLECKDIHICKDQE